MKQLVAAFFVIVILIFAGSSCNKDIKDGLTSLVNITSESPGEYCSSGGYKIESGMDQNKNNVLDSIEVQDMEYICNGNNGYTSLVDVFTESPGENCIEGGFKIETGIDLNNNDTLDTGEVQHSEYICNGNFQFFGEIQTGFEAGIIYHAETDGFLYVRYSSTTIFGNIEGLIYSDKAENPGTKIGLVNFVPGSTTVPVQKNNYWRVTNIAGCAIVIKWMPFQ